jgi:hypothetical protein
MSLPKGRNKEFQLVTLFLALWEEIPALSPKPK